MRRSAAAYGLRQMLPVHTISTSPGDGPSARRRSTARRRSGCASRSGVCHARRSASAGFTGQGWPADHGRRGRERRESGPRTCITDWRLARAGLTSRAPSGGAISLQGRLLDQAMAGPPGNGPEPRVLQPCNKERARRAIKRRAARGRARWTPRPSPAAAARETRRLGQVCNRSAGSRVLGHAAVSNGVAGSRAPTRWDKRSATPRPHMRPVTAGGGLNPRRVKTPWHQGCAVDPHRARLSSRRRRHNCREQGRSSHFGKGPFLGGSCRARTPGGDLAPWQTTFPLNPAVPVWTPRSPSLRSRTAAPVRCPRPV